MSTFERGHVPRPSHQPDARALPPMKPLTVHDQTFEAIAHTREAAITMLAATTQLLEIAQAMQTPPEWRTIAIDGTKGYTTTDKAPWEAKSIGILNPTSVSIFVGIGGISATPTSRAPACPPQNMLILPLRDYDIELGCDPAQLLGNTAVFFVMRFQAVQQPFLSRII